MTREDKLYTMRGAELIGVAEKLGVKVAHKGNNLKESKDKAIAKILAAEAAFEDEIKTAAEEVADAEPTLTVPMPIQYDENGPHLIEKADEVDTIAKAEPVKKEHKGKGRQILITIEDAHKVIADVPAIEACITKRGCIDIKVDGNKVAEIWTVNTKGVVRILVTTDRFDDHATVLDVAHIHKNGWKLPEMLEMPLEKTAETLVKLIG